jgi:Xaa-Pro aminopeptidase
MCNYLPKQDRPLFHLFSLRRFTQMKTIKATRKLMQVLALVSLCLNMALPVGAAHASLTDKDRLAAIRVTPPAPVFDETARLAELAQRRARVAERIGPKGLLVLFSTQPRVYANDVDYQYRQENNLYYLTNLKQKGATLVLMPGNSQLSEILFLPRRDPAAETWTGHMYSPDEARAASGINEIWEAKEFEPFMQALRNRQPYRPKPESQLLSATSDTSAGNNRPVTPPVPQAAQTLAAAEAARPARPVTGNSAANLATANPPTTSQTIAPAVSGTSGSAATQTAPTGYETLFNAMGKGEADLYLLIPREGESAEYRQEQNFAAQWARSATGFNIRNSWPIFNQMRQRKSAMELQLLQHAIDISIEAHERAQAVAKQAQHEYEVDAEIAYTFKRRNADNWGYPDIVGCGPNATTLHYIESQGQVKPDQLILIDAGAEYEHYSADVTRTFPVSGKFTPEQAAIYQVVYDAQEAAARAIKPGASVLVDVHNAATEVVKDGLLRLGLITDRNSNQYRIWFMHGTSHWLGMNVHDVGVRDAKLEAGMVFTNEPGIYIREDALDNLPKTPENEKFIAAVRPAFLKYKGIGVRIEDDMLVTSDGYKWMTEALPRSIKEIENFMARARQEMRTSQLERKLFEKDSVRFAGIKFSDEGTRFFAQPER